jgi:hypothetical protein
MKYSNNVLIDNAKHNLSMYTAQLQYIEEW